MKKYLKLKVFNLYGGAALTTDDENPFTCPVCLEEYNDSNVRPTTLNCGHSLCIKCLTRIKEVNPNCPICREPISRLGSNPSFTIEASIVYLKQKVTNLEKEKRKLKSNLERELKAERRQHDRTKEREKRLKKQLEPEVEKKSFVIAKDYDTTVIKNEKKVAAVAAEEKPKLRYPEAETEKFKEEKRDPDIDNPFLDGQLRDAQIFNDKLAIKKYINRNGLEEFDINEYADKVTFNGGREKRENIRIVNKNFHGIKDKTGLPLYGIVYMTVDGVYTTYTGSSNFIQLGIKNYKERKEAAERGEARIDPEVYKLIEKINQKAQDRREKKRVFYQNILDKKYAEDD